MGYTKLFSSIVASTIWREDLPTKVVWITMLAMKNDRHVVEGSVPGLAHLAGVSVKECQVAIKKFLAPDPYSRNQDYQGRRIKVAEGGWLVLNGEYYRHQLSKEERREYQRIKQAEYRRARKHSRQPSPEQEEELEKAQNKVRETTKVAGAAVQQLNKIQREIEEVEEPPPN